MKKTIILIDDDQDDLDFLKEEILILDPTSLCICFNNPEQAMNILRSETIYPPDFIFIDYNMPGLTGDQCVIELRGAPKFQNSTITILSTSMPAHKIALFKSLGTDYAFSKPIKASALREILLEVFELSV